MLRRTMVFFCRTAIIKQPLPHWQEYYVRAKEYCYFQIIIELPVEGVIMLELIKP